MDEQDREVRYDIWCQKCKYHDLDEHDDPCDECMTEFTNYASEKPIMFKEKD
jgi:hypothetical protein